MTDIAEASVLVVEDEPALIDLLTAAVEEAGCTVIGPAEDVASALDLIGTNTISAAIVDLIVHGVYADAIVIELAKRGIPFAVTTGIGADFSHPELQGAVTITKPFQASHIKSVLEGLLGRDHRLDETEHAN